MQNPEEHPVVWLFFDGCFFAEGRQAIVEQQTEIHGLSVRVDGRILELIEADIDASGEGAGSVEFNGKSYGWKFPNW